MPGVCNRTDDRADWRNEPTGAGPLFIIFFFCFFSRFFFRSRKVNVRRRSTRFDTVTRFPTEGFWIKRAMNKRNADASILEHKKREGGGFFFRNQSGRNTRRLCQLSTARASFRSDVQKNNAKVIMQAEGSHRCAPLTIPESATRPSTRRATIRIIMLSPFFFSKSWEAARLHLCRFACDTAVIYIHARVSPCAEL